MQMQICDDPKSLFHGVLPVFASWNELQQLKQDNRKGGPRYPEQATLKEEELAAQMKFKMLLDVVDINYQNKVKP